MIVFQRNWEHVKERCEDPARCGKPFAWLVDIVVDINRYLPDDWRLTRSTNNFRIQIVTPDVICALVGFSYRSSLEQIIHVCNTVFAKYFFDAHDLINAGVTGQVKAAVLKQHPEVSTPNLYYFKPVPPGFMSPLFARQYEKISFNPNNSIQYHRIHPLFSHGLDLEHYLWVRWNINGDVTVATPKQGYHGKDYWLIENITKTRGQGAAKEYQEIYNSIVQQFTSIEKASPASIQDRTHSTEYKYIVPPPSDDNGDLLVKLISEYAQKRGFVQEISCDVFRYKDIYLDDYKHSLLACGMSLRIRKKQELTTLCLKRILNTRERLRYTRFREEIAISNEQAEVLGKGRPLMLLPVRMAEAVVPDHGTFRPVLQVATERRQIYLKWQSIGAMVRLSLDRVTYTSGKKEIGTFLELELELEGAEQPVKEFSLIIKYIEEQLALLPSMQTKYERGMSLLKTIAQTRPSTRKKVIIDTDCGVDDALALSLAFRSPELDVMAVTTVAGNVQVEKVIPNVFKVYSALGLKDPPPVAMGADRPLEKRAINADAVHGKDGLGDVIAEPDPDSIDIDDLPAWELICKLARENPGEITLITIGPMTNAALAIQNDPKGVACLKEIVSMGGVFFDVGNVGPDAEFNVAADPEAVALCVDFCRKSLMEAEPDQQVPLTFVGLDVTHKVCLRRAILDHLVRGNPDNGLLRFIQIISDKYMEFYKNSLGIPGCCLHDPLAVGWVINSAFLDIEKHVIRVETRGQFTSGVIFPDDRPGRNPDEAVIGIARKVEKEAFEEFFLQRIMVDG